MAGAIAAITAGVTHTLMLLKNAPSSPPHAPLAQLCMLCSVLCHRGGEVYSWGRNDFGQLGHGGNENELSPRVICSLRASGFGFRFLGFRV